MYYLKASYLYQSLYWGILKKSDRWKKMYSYMFYKKSWNSLNIGRNFNLSWIKLEDEGNLMKSCVLDLDNDAQCTLLCNYYKEENDHTHYCYFYYIYVHTHII